MAKPKHDAQTATAETTYKMGPAEYNPRASHNEAAWQKVQGVLTKGKGTARVTDLKVVLAKHFNKPDQSHYDFINYMVQGSHLEVTSGS